eukprot:g17167.t1
MRVASMVEDLREGRADWNDVPEDMRRVPSVIREAMLAAPWAVPEWHWANLPAELRLDPAIVEAAEMRVASMVEDLREGRADWRNVPEDMRTVPSVIREAMLGGNPWAVPQWRWANLPAELQLDPAIVEVAIKTGKLTPLWSSLSADVRAVPAVVKAALVKGLLTPKQWDSLPKAVRADVDAATTAIDCAVIQTRKQWLALPAEVRKNPKVVRAAALQKTRIIRNPAEWERDVPADNEARNHADVIVQAIR